MMPARAQSPQNEGSNVRRIHMGKAPAVSCPVCGEKAHTRSSTEITPTYRELYYRCSNIACGMTWVASLSFERVLSPSGMGSDFRQPRPARERPPGEDFGQMTIFEVLPPKPSG